MADTKHMRLGDILIQAGVLTESTLNAALKEQKVSSMRLGEILVKNRLGLGEAFGGGPEPAAEGPLGISC